MGPALGQVAAKLVHIQPEGLPCLSRAQPRGLSRGRGRGACAGPEADFLPVGVQPVVGDGLSEGMEGAAQGGPAPGRVGLGPEQSDQKVAPVALARDRQIGQQGQSLAPVQLDRHAVALDAGRAEQIQSKAGHHDTSSML